MYITMESIGPWSWKSTPFIEEDHLVYTTHLSMFVLWGEPNQSGGVGICIDVCSHKVLP